MTGTTKGTPDSVWCALRPSCLPVFLSAESLRDLSPVHRVPPRLEVIRPAVLVLEVVGVLPHVVAEERRGLAVHEWVVLVRRARDGQLAALVHQPHPPRPEAADAGGVELLLEL